MKLTKCLSFKKILHAAQRPFIIGNQPVNIIEGFYEKELYVIRMCKGWRKEESKLLLTKR